MKKSWLNKDFFKLVQLVVKTPLDHKWFKVRKQLNYQAAEFLRHYKPFQDEIVDIRKKLKIPKLNPDTDWDLVNVRGLEIEDSDWLLGQGDAFSDKYEEIISGLLKKYNLATSFHDWIDAYILYGTPSFTPSYNMEFANTFMSDPQEAQRTPLTSEEKRLARFMMKGKVRLNGLPTTPSRAKRFLNIVKNSKNTRRPTRAKTAIKTLTVGEKGKTYGDVVVKEFSFDEETKIGSQKLKSRLRQQKHRLLQRYNQKT